MLEVIDYLKGDRPVYALVAPAAEGQFGVDITMESIRNGVKKLWTHNVHDSVVWACIITLPAFLALIRIYVCLVACHGNLLQRGSSA